MEMVLESMDLREIGEGTKKPPPNEDDDAKCLKKVQRLSRNTITV